jgi:hypothetical protein
LSISTTGLTCHDGPLRKVAVTLRTRAARAVAVRTVTICRITAYCCVLVSAVHRPRSEAGHGRSAGILAHVSRRSTLAGMSENSLSVDAEVADHQVIFRAGRVEAVVVPLEEYRALKALEQREAELYWVAHESRYPSRPGDDVPDGNVYDSMEALVADLGARE